MLFIYGTLTVGGIETFFVRMAKERARLGLHTSILLFSKPEDSDKALLAEMRKYATVIFPEEIFFNIPKLVSRFPLLIPVKNKALMRIFSNVDQIHVFDGMHALLGYRFTNMLGINIPITVGFYHYIKYLWGGDKVAFYEKLNRDFIFNYLPKENLCLFSEGNRLLYEKYKNIDLSGVSTFRLGVIDKKNIKLTVSNRKPLRIIAIGRLVEFKTYNFYMLNVVKNLIEKGIPVEFYIYGDGPLFNEIKSNIIELGLEDNVFLKGTLDYLEFDKVVMQHDIFIGSGTAIIQAAALGVPSIVGVENVVEPESYGYFSDVHQYEYNVKGLDLPMVQVEKLIVDYLEKDSHDKLELKKAHLKSIDEFTNESCQYALDNLKRAEMPCEKYRYSIILYYMSKVFDGINIRVNKNHPRRTQFRDFIG